MKSKTKKRIFKQRQHILSLKVHLSNIRGLHSNLYAVQHHLETERPHLLFLTETQIKKPADVSYLQYPGYSLEHSFKPRAGVCMYARSDVCCRRLRNMEVSNFSVMWCLLDTGMVQTVYACIYRSHSGDQETTRLFEYLTETIDTVQRRYPTAQIVVLGDFNAHHQDWLFPYQTTDHAGREALKFALSLDLSQLVQEATRIPDVDGHTPNCLDLLLTSDPDRFSVSVAAPLGTSDHCVVKSVSNYHPPDSGPSGTRRMWRYKSADWDEMRHFFASFPWRQTCFSSSDPSSCEQAISGVIRQAMEYFIPYADVSLAGKVPRWYNAECAAAAASKDLAFVAWTKACTMKAPDISSKKRAFNFAAKSFKKVLKRACFSRTTRIGAKLVSYPRGSKAFWSLAKSVEASFCRSSLPPLLKPDGSLAFTAAEKANLLASLFAENSQLDAGSASPPCLPHCGSTMLDIHIRQKEVLKVLRNLDVSKASGPDGIPAVVLKICAPELSPVLTRLYRLSLSSAQVPKAWKIANVQPVPKKGSRADPVNYRPIAITSILCKSLERVVNNRLLAYLEDNELLSDQQYGFRRNRSTGDLLVYATHIWGEAIERYGEALAISLDVSKAFDRVWHESLLSKLPAYGIPTSLCDWTSDFLNGRSFRVVLDGSSSDLMAINAGVPQGSVLSATLFLLHINDLLKPGIFGYADDSTVTERYMSGPRTSAAEILEHREALVERVNLTLKGVSDWGDTNLVRFNAAKTQACLFTAKRSLFPLTPSFRSMSVPITDSVELLGINISSNLNFGQCIESKAKIAGKKLGILNKVKRYFTPEQLLMLYQAQVRSCMEYCSHLWDGSAKYQLGALDSVDRRARRLVGDQTLVNSKLQSLEHRRKVACLSVFYRIYFGECAQELFDLVPASPFYHRTARHRKGLHPYIVEIPRTRTKRFASSFLIRTARMWNALPASTFPSIFNISTFKSRVNRHLLGRRAST